MNDQKKSSGGCLCGDIRFGISGLPQLVEYCHCSSCRRASGAPVMAWAGVRLSDFEFTRGQPGRYQSSHEVERTFCSRCGASLTIYIRDYPQEIYVSISGLDDPDAMKPDVHIWRSEKLSWFETADKLPRYSSFKSDGILE